jgi:hypothetical protein
MVELHNILSKRLRFFSNLCVIVRRPGLYQLLALPPWQNDEFTLSIAVTYEKIGWSKLRLKRAFHSAHIHRSSGYADLKNGLEIDMAIAQAFVRIYPNADDPNLMTYLNGNGSSSANNRGAV